MIFTSLRDYGENLQKADESSSSDDTDEESKRSEKKKKHTKEVSVALKKLEDLKRDIYAAWEEKRILLTQCIELCQFKTLIEAAHNRMTKHEAFLNNDDLGVSFCLSYWERKGAITLLVLSFCPNLNFNI